MSKAQLEELSSAVVQHAKSFARAGQILAEMLGLVCHNDYFTFPDHMVCLNNLQVLTVRFLSCIPLDLTYPFTRQYAPLNIFELFEQQISASSKASDPLRFDTRNLVL
jgi:hypothetical protein